MYLLTYLKPVSRISGTFLALKEPESNCTALPYSSNSFKSVYSMLGNYTGQTDQGYTTAVIVVLNQG